MIKLQVIGNLGKRLHSKNNVNGKSVINFSIAHTEKFKDSQGVAKERTIWVECAYWTDRTGISPYLKKGTQVYVEGTPDIRTYTTQDGRQGAALSLRIQSVQLLGARTSSNDSAPENNMPSHSNMQAVPQSSAAMVEEMDDLPF